MNFLTNIRAQLKNRFNDATETQRDLMRLVAAVLVLGGIGAGGWWFLAPHFREVRQEQALAQATTAMETRDYRTALLALQRATQIDPNHLETRRKVANFLSTIGSPDAVSAFQGASQLAPGDITLRMAVVQEALRFGQIDVVRENLPSLPEPAKTEIAFHRIAAALAVVDGDPSRLEGELLAIIARQPENLPARFNLAAIQLWSGDPAASTRAQEALFALASQPTVRVRSSIELLRFATTDGSPLPLATTTLTLLKAINPAMVATVGTARAGEPAPGWFLLIDELKQTAAAGQPEDIALCAQWLSAIGQTREALVWLESTPHYQQGASTVLSQAADLAARLGDETRLMNLLRANAWGRITPEAVTLAQVAHWQTVQYDRARGQGTWQDALTACGDDITAKSVLVRLADAWNHPTLLEATLTQITNQHSKSNWAFEALAARYSIQKDPEKLWSLYRSWVAQPGIDHKVQTQWLLLSALLGRTSDQTTATARNLQRAFPDDAEAAVAYAAVLWRTGAATQALVLITDLAEADQASPNATFWRSVILADINRIDSSESTATIPLGAVNAQQIISTAWQYPLWPLERSLLRDAATKVRLTLPDQPTA